MRNLKFKIAVLALAINAALAGCGGRSVEQQKQDQVTADLQAASDQKQQEAERIRHNQQMIDVAMVSTPATPYFPP